MSRPIVLCRAEGCRDNYQSKNPRPMKMLREFTCAYSFKCETCGWIRVWTKDQIGGTMGSGVRPDGSGQSGGEGVSRYVSGADIR